MKGMFVFNIWSLFLVGTPKPDNLPLSDMILQGSLRLVMCH